MDSPSKQQQNLKSLEKQIEHLETLAGDNKVALDQLHQLHEKVNALRMQVHSGMSAWQRTELARHAQRPYTLDYIDRIFTDWSEIHGDRAYGDDPAIICGMAKFHDEEVLIIGHQKARDTKQKVYRNFGMPNPEGYRKALRTMHMAQKFGRPILTFVDTPGAYPGLGAEERGQAEAIARNLREMARMEVPIIATITGEGGSGGALAIAVADRVLMMENSVYSVISPEGCASIMWRDATKKEVAAQALKITARDLKELKMIDDVVPEPEGGAHNDHDKAAAYLAESLTKHLAELRGKSISELKNTRYEKFRKMGQFFTER
ncbi:MAG: acetyl-CoA carboxylase carboxyltransferase subunit alpha [Acidobacteriales bacterium]|nr:acetyl-CoA carboxylase carboxyltransferase subunit alpha [Terriglobales bacterium]